MSQISDTAEVMRKLLWQNLVKAWAEKAVIVVPFLGWPVVKQVFFYLIETYLVDPLFVDLARFGVFTSIEWRDEIEYAAYKTEAQKVIVLQSLSSDWPKEEREVFKNAAKNLIRFHVATA